ncbi:MAG: methylated-DNA--[protein]-cysteine S-methyltransferase [Candidatus Latescibacteria bacterium]|nr:methylated-DNA--[protein]-cysteine S-methyltransferase [Candidatus Latescibacterota bacterium]
MTTTTSEMELHTPLGMVHLRWHEGELTELHLGPFEPGAHSQTPSPAPATGEKLVADLCAYFQGEAVDFGFSLPEGIGTPFQRRVWQALIQIPRGRCATYGGLARTLGLPPNSARAVGLACGANPLPILVPCHRVVSAEGDLTGFTGGLPWKRALLELEGVPLCNDQVLAFSLV